MRHNFRNGIVAAVNRRHLLLTALGALAGSLGVSNVSGERERMIDVGGDLTRAVTVPIAGASTVVVSPNIQIGSLIIRDEAEAEAFLRHLAKVISAA